MSERADGPAESESGAFGRTYWLLNSIEAFERLAYFGIRAVVPLYIMQATEPGGLHLTALHKGTIYAWWAVFQSFLPIVTGGIADRYGYKRVLAGAISLNVVGYVMMANLHSYWGFFAGILVLATGTAFFKPSLQGSLAQSLTKANSSLGWGVFYWVVNVGAFAAPFMSTLVLGKPHSLEGWQFLFYLCAGFTSCNLLLLLTFKDVPSGASKTETVLQVLKRTIVNIFEVRLVTWLLIMSCFWLMMYQLWDLHPNFITDWVDSSHLAALAPFDAWREYGDRGLMQVPQQILLNLNAGLIIVLIVPLSWASRKMRTLSAMLVGMSVATCGVLVAGMTGNGWFLLLGIVFFSLGEMWTGPKKNEYLGLIAPPGKKGLYLGYVNIPVGVGVFVGSYMAGFIYDNYGEKATLALKELGTQPAVAARAAQSIDWSDVLDKIPALAGIDGAAAFDTVAQDLEIDSEGAAEVLRRTYRYDRGQVINLGLLHLASQSSVATKVRVGLAGMLLESDDPARVELGKGLEQARESVGIARFVDLLPKAMDVKRSEVWRLVRELESSDDRPVEDAAIERKLWELYGADPQVLNNLALEYLAQGTSRVRDAVAAMTFETPVEELPARVGIDRTKAFRALCAATGANPEAVERALSGLGVAEAQQHVAAQVYLISQPHVRFNAVARRVWSQEVNTLSEMIGADETALAAAGGIEMAELAERRDLIQAAFAAKDWAARPEHAAYLLGMSDLEARAMVAAELEKTPLEVTKLLWEKYDPNYRVWIPFALIGVAATIAIGVFGRMAKRWKDMNA